MHLLKDPVIIAGLNLAWEDSMAANAGQRLEEGGYIVHNADGSRAILRWPKGQRYSIIPPPLDLGSR